MRASFTPFQTICRGLCFGTLVFVGGCSAFTPTSVRAPEGPEKIVFDSMSSFYCSEQRWPKSWDELIHYEGLSPEGHHAVGEMLAPQMSSPRAILMVVRYKNMQGIDRKVTYIAPPECAGSKDPERVSMAGGRVTFTKLAGFEALNGAAIKAKWQDGPYPDVAWQDDSRNVFVTMSFGEVPLEPGELNELKGELEAAYEASIPGIAWIEKSLAADDEPPKLIHMFSSASPTGEMLSYSMSMSFDGRILSISISGPAAQQEEIQATADRLRRSLRLR